MDYCTLFDRNYLTRGLALYRSLVGWDNALRLWVLCLDGQTETLLRQLDLPGLHLIALPALEAGDPALAATRSTRTPVEYYFTCTPALVSHLFATVTDIGCLTYIDADLYFFGDPQAIFDEIGDAEIGIVGHRFPPHLTELEKYGRYNVAWNTFRRGPEGMACLARWREQCIEWCYDRLEDGRFGDQKYLDEWPGLYESLQVIAHPGANLAPWNYPNIRLTQRERTYFTNDQRLIFYHFHGFKQLASHIFESGLREPPGRELSDLYREYCGELQKSLRIVTRQCGVELSSNSLRHVVNEGDAGLVRRLWCVLYWGTKAVSNYWKGFVVIA